MSDFHKITEQASNHDHLEKLDAAALLEKINQEDRKVAPAVARCIPEIARLVAAMEPRFLSGGRLFYIGAGTSGRLGILDASEIPPTYGMPHDRVIGLIAGGDQAIRKAVEHAEDDTEQAWKDLAAYDIGKLDTLVGIAASGTTPYVLGGIRKAREEGILTAGITNNPGSPLAAAAEISIAVDVGPEFVTGSTRMKSGTSQKLVLNMISTSLMIRIGRVKGNKMVHMQLSNNKLIDRGTRYLMESLDLDYQAAGAALKRYGSVQEALQNLKKD
ncbi:N-acetylmuramic acid 6-phosphate etherase [Robiginitalea sp. SC105]|uniref:N-acetylmuramic acid 6-phosphate etherase n=1 Tax=Robiginitalea sp. SC105 TaxID=2762332 RepID=UPI001639EC8B|nr:N-acetylmuramic acid 6-phosphate etherase [Robiginitalea sp. SC105]MBC2839254.1 N-acetylmuramic acid 6-phosphate etherase [Robiginitalea sp. SC105]